LPDEDLTGLLYHLGTVGHNFECQHDEDIVALVAHLRDSRRDVAELRRRAEPLTDAELDTLETSLMLSLLARNVRRVDLARLFAEVRLRRARELEYDLRHVDLPLRIRK
jgi:hypothetical protein